MLKKKHLEVIAELRSHATRHDKAYYKEVRDDGHAWQNPAKLAARLIYLNKTCFNGLYRVNRQGRFNVPVGSHENPCICDEANLAAVAKTLRATTLKAGTFEKIKPKAGDLVYCDPPYDKTFAAYTKKGFNSEDQTALRNKCLEWMNAGARVIVSNSDTRLIRSLYRVRDEFEIVEVQASRSINCNGDGRGKTTELLISGK